MLSIRELRDRAVIRPIKRAVEDEFLDLPGVTGVDVGAELSAGAPTGRQAIVVSVADKLPIERLVPAHRVPSEVFGVPTDVVEERPVLQHLHSQRELSPAPRRRVAGISPAREVRLEPPDVPAGGCYRRTGTLGLLVTGAGTQMGLTTFDVACLDDAWSIGDRMVDPENGRGYADLARAALSARVDAAAVALSGRLPDGDGAGQVTGHAPTYPGEWVRKTGFGTGVTVGVVTSVDATLRLDHGAALGVRVLRDQIRIIAVGSRFCGPGDAGAAVLDTDGRAVGVQLAAARMGAVGFACPIGDVLVELDVQLCTSPSGSRQPLTP
ncbi:hypothetical protein IQ251_10420 [Saccharopolyspora sp. HNM0983]|uniref:Uncharacterized protein n=1 Tax=Saccharopolyspora montiporae TaxID=2781240 RepID=A0A929FXN4_9PSEU|nr:hypothetical protein [Saccharopolyspora sp. HNM0983]MBE9374856.1 hypothetical protein [Saccharopolyspora sp. HNM0983]